MPRSHSPILRFEFTYWHPSLMFKVKDLHVRDININVQDGMVGITLTGPASLKDGSPAARVNSRLYWANGLAADEINDFDLEDLPEEVLIQIYEILTTAPAPTDWQTRP